MKGKHLVIGLLVFVIVACAVVVLAMKAQFNKDEKTLEAIQPVAEIVESITLK